MNSIKAIVRNGRIETDLPLGLPDGTELWIPIPGDDDFMSPDELASVLAAMDRLQPLEMTPEELDELEADRRARREWEKARFHEDGDELERMWE